MGGSERSRCLLALARRWGVMVAWEREAVSVPSREVSCRAREAAVGGRTVGAGVW